MARGDTTLLTATVEEPVESSVPGSQVFKIAREPYAAAIVNAVAANWQERTGRPQLDMADALTIRVKQKVTLIYTGETMLGAGLLIAREGTLFEGSRGIAILPKGARKNGYSIDVSRVVDVLDGYDAATATRLAEKARSYYPTLRKLTQERLEELPPFRPDGDIHLCVFGSWPTPEGVTADAIWLAGAYNREDDIVDNSVILLRPEYGVSESGSVYGQALLRASVGEVVGFPGMTFRDALSLTDLDYEEAAATVFGLVAAAAAS